MRNPSRYYYLLDGLGSVVAMTDSAGAITNTFKYDPYGNDIGTTGTVKNPIRFQGQYYSSSLKLYKMGLRFYDPGLGRWTQRDPVEQPLQTSGWNDYVFAGDSPVNYVDPSGTHTVTVSACLIVCLRAASDKRRDYGWIGCCGARGLSLMVSPGSPPRGTYFSAGGCILTVCAGYDKVRNRRTPTGGVTSGAKGGWWGWFRYF